MQPRPPHRILMCPPDHFGVEYVINPWMEGNVSRASAEEARSQWERLLQHVAAAAEPVLMEAAAGVPDLVFTANAGLVLGRTVMLSHFRHPERQREEPHFRAWFRSQGMEVLELPSKISFEGAGDALLDRGTDRLWLGYGWRTDREAADVIAEAFALDVVALRLADRRFYHLDTCFCPLTGGKLLWYPAAFDLDSRLLVESLVAPGDRHAVSDADAAAFACNAIDTGTTIILNDCSQELENRLTGWGLSVVRTPMSQFMMSGGACKCLSLRLTEPAGRITLEGLREVC